jgi:hypothetical protein
LQQEDLDQFEYQPAADYPLRRDTDTSIDVRDLRGGVTTSPWPRLSLSAGYRWIQKRTRYDHLMDLVPSPFGDFPGDGHSAFIRDRDTTTDEVEARLTYRWSAWLKTTVSYRLVASDYWTSTDPVAGFDPITFLPIPGHISPGSRVLAGNYDAAVYGFNAVVRPVRGLSLNTTLSLRDARTASAANDHPSVAAYRGQTWNVVVGGTYSWDPRTDLLVNYAFAHADYEEDESLAGLPLGVVFEQHALMAGLRRRISDRVTTALRYGFFLYDEPTSGGFHDYTAHQIFATVSVRIP